jgi:hypothetical protein
MKGQTRNSGLDTEKGTQDIEIKWATSLQGLIDEWKVQKCTLRECVQYASRNIGTQRYIVHIFVYSQEQTLSTSDVFDSLCAENERINTELGQTALSRIIKEVFASAGADTVLTLALDLVVHLSEQDSLDESRRKTRVAVLIGVLKGAELSRVQITPEHVSGDTLEFVRERVARLLDCDDPGRPHPKLVARTFEELKGLNQYIEDPGTIRRYMDSLMSDPKTYSTCVRLLPFTWRHTDLRTFFTNVLQKKYFDVAVDFLSEISLINSVELMEVHGVDKTELATICTQTAIDEHSYAHALHIAKHYRLDRLEQKAALLSRLRTIDKFIGKGLWYIGVQRCKTLADEVKYLHNC